MSLHPINRRLGSLGDDAQRESLIEWGKKEYPDKFISWSCEYPALRFRSIEDAERFIASLEAGKPDWNIPIIPYDIAKQNFSDEYLDALYEAVAFVVSDKV